MPNAVPLKHIHVRNDVDTEGVTATKWALDPNLGKRGPLKVSHWYFTKWWNIYDKKHR